MIEAIVAIIAIVILCGFALTIWRQADIRGDKKTWTTLANSSLPYNEIFDQKMVADAPEPARRYFTYMIASGARLYQSVHLEMSGELGFGTKEKPTYRPFTATQILAPPNGFVWRVKAGAISGSDGALTGQSWTRFWLFGVLPIVRVADDADHLRSANGRLIAEAAFWAPASLLPGKHIIWEAAGPNTARANISFGGFQHSVEIELAANGEPRSVLIQRWSNVNDEKIYRLQPFGGVLTDFRDFNEYRLPTRIEGGNHFGTEKYFPFFKANIKEIYVA